MTDFIPNFQQILRARTPNVIYNGDSATVSLITEEQEQNTFVISLSAERKRDHTTIRLETRIAIEKHLPGKGHDVPHLQFQNFSTGQDDLKTGTLHIKLLPENQEELDHSCNGFIYSLAEMLSDIQQKFNIKQDLKNYFFYPEIIDSLFNDKIELQKLIYTTFKLNLDQFSKDQKLVEYKGKKGEEFNIENPFKLLSLLLMMGLPHYLLLEPLLKVIIEVPRVKSSIPDIDIKKYIQILAKLKTPELEHFNEAQFISEVSQK